MRFVMKITNPKLLEMGYTNKYKIKPAGTTDYYMCTNINGTRQYEHIIIYKLFKGDIPTDMVIHHIDGDGLNNDINNLECISRADHRFEHAKKINIDGVDMTLDEVCAKFGYSDKANCIKALKKGGRDWRSKFYGHIVKYE